MPKSTRKPLAAVFDTDLSDDAATGPANDNNLARTRAPEAPVEVERMHRKYGDLDRKYHGLKRERDELSDQVDMLARHLRRRTGALLTGFVTIEAKAVYCMSIASLGDNQWWANGAQALTGLVLGGFIIWPNVRKLLRISSDTAGIKMNGKAKNKK
jgi:hypothetical protein